MVIYKSGGPHSTRATAKLTNENWIDALCDMAHENPTPIEAIITGLRQLRVSRTLLRCPENQEND
jgi:hypothetical protein